MLYMPHTPLPFKAAVAPARSVTPAKDAAPIISLKGIHKSFGSQVVFDGLDLDIYPAKTTVVLGPSGSGKSVMLKHIVGLLKPDTGEVYFDGRRTDDLSERKLAPMRIQTGLLFQSGALFDSMTVEDNIAFPLIEHTFMLREQRHEAVMEALKTVDLVGVEKKLPAQLSGGQRKRVALARAIVLRRAWSCTTNPPRGWTPSGPTASTISSSSCATRWA